MNRNKIIWRSTMFKKVTIILMTFLVFASFSVTHVEACKRPDKPPVIKPKPPIHRPRDVVSLNFDNADPLYSSVKCPSLGSYRLGKLNPGIKAFLNPIPSVTAPIPTLDF